MQLSQCGGTHADQVVQFTAIRLSGFNAPAGINKSSPNVQTTSQNTVLWEIAKGFKAFCVHQAACAMNLQSSFLLTHHE